MTPLNVYLAGLGSVGGELLRQIEHAGNGALRLVGACTSRGAAFDPAGLITDRARTDAIAGGHPNWETVLSRLSGLDGRTVMVDATGSAEVASLYEACFERGLHVATPSKLANAESQRRFERLQRTAGAQGVHYRFEATVGAGLPILGTVQDLTATGDRVVRAEGVLSGTMTYLFSEIADGVPLSEAVRTALANGYAEPDPRDDLSGEDVVRKMLILARTAGLRVEREEVAVESLVPRSLAHVSREAFLDGLPEYDEAWRKRAVAADAQEERLRYVGRLTTNASGAARITVGPEAVSIQSPLGQLRGTDNLLQLTTERYAASPLIIQGPGAGPAVTAGGVFSDILDIARLTQS